MGDVARCSVKNEDLLYKLFGKNAELLIDHAWGWEPCTVEAIKAYKPSTNSLGSGQVLHCPYEAEKAKLKLNMVDGGDLRAYVNLIVDGMDREQLAAMEKLRWASPQKFASKSRAFWSSTTRRLSSHGLTGAKSYANLLTGCLRQSTPQAVRRFMEGRSMKPRRT